MKKLDLTKKLKKLGWYLDREGAGHEVWTNGKMKQMVPRHREINELLAKSILKKAKSNPAEGGRR